jgi:hypothetical protein
MRSAAVTVPPRTRETGVHGWSTNFETASAAIPLDRPQIAGEAGLRIQVAHFLD